MSRRVLTGVLAALASIAVVGCASDPAPVELADRLLANERLAYEARARDLDEAERAIGEARERVLERCEQWAAARVALLEARLDHAELALRDDFETRAWSLLWDAYPRAAESQASAIHQRLADATRTAAEAARAAGQHPNDARLARQLAEARVEEAGLALLGEQAYIDGARRLAGEIEALRRRLRDRMAAAFAPLRAELGRIGSAPCAPSNAGGETERPISDRRAAYAALHGAQVEGLTTLRAWLERPSAARLVASGAAEALKERLALVLPPAWVDPLLEEGMRRVGDGIDRAERELRDTLNRDLDALRRGLDEPA